MRRIPIELAAVILVVVVAVGTVTATGLVGRWLATRTSARFVRWGARFLAAAFLAAAVGLGVTFFFETDQRDPVHRGVLKFGLGEVVVAASLAGYAALALAWTRWRGLGGLLGVAGGAALVAKPICWPLEHEPGRAYTLLSETHLYFVLSGLLLAALGLGILGRAVAVRTRSGKVPARQRAVTVAQGKRPRP